MEFYGPSIDPPEDLSLKARLAWKYFFENGWQITAACDSVYIVTDESHDLSGASIYPDVSELIDWLESTADAHLEDDPKSFLSTFVQVPDLLSDSVIAEIKKLL